MKKSDIKREELKSNYLKKAIIRFDYSGVIEIEDTIEKLGKILYDSGYKELKEGYISEVAIKLSDPKMIETQLSVTTEELVKNKSYRFTNPDNGVSIEITKFFIALNIDYRQYVKFESYADIFCKVSHGIKTANTYLKPLRIGERKINSVFLYSGNDISDYFEEEYVGYIPSSLDGVKLHNSQKLDSFTDEDGVSINLIRHLSTGKMQKDGKEVDALRIIIDIDSYFNKDYLGFDSYFENEGKMKEVLTILNESNFCYYKEVMKKSFIEKLKAEKFDDDKILGVEKND